MTAHELGKTLLEGPDWPVKFQVGYEFDDVEVTDVERQLDHPGSESAYIGLT